MYMHEALRQPDRQEFIKAMQKEVQDQVLNGNFCIVPQSSMPKGEKDLPMVWQMNRKWDRKNRKIKKYKAQLTVDGSKMIQGVHYEESYAPVATWNLVRAMRTMVAVNGWHTKQIDYVLAYLQTAAKKVLYMNIPRGFALDGASIKDYVLRLEKNLYG